MTKSLFGLILIILGLLYGLKGFLTKVINKQLKQKDIDFELKSSYISYLLFFLLVITLVLGMMLGKQTTQKTYKNVSDGFHKLKSAKQDRPNPLFDINTYW